MCYPAAPTTFRQVPNTRAYVYFWYVGQGRLALTRLGRDGQQIHGGDEGGSRLACSSSSCSPVQSVLVNCPGETRKGRGAIRDILVGMD